MNNHTQVKIMYSLSIIALIITIGFGYMILSTGEEQEKENIDKEITVLEKKQKGLDKKITTLKKETKPASKSPVPSTKKTVSPKASKIKVSKTKDTNLSPNTPKKDFVLSNDIKALFKNKNVKQVIEILAKTPSLTEEVNPVDYSKNPVVQKNAKEDLQASIKQSYLNGYPLSEKDKKETYEYALRVWTTHYTVLAKINRALALFCGYRNASKKEYNLVGKEALKSIIENGILYNRIDPNIFYMSNYEIYVTNYLYTFEALLEYYRNEKPHQEKEKKSGGPPPFDYDSYIKNHKKNK